ncbi:hypothetical protein GTA08_BOTSDO08613 [Neofusicoccum parvum]|uniref:Uncharacterized protein n=1 Tax=Neofusicoccum parvum TaxID=310453 RepID=A0ACB5S9G8_9PEZI|nr:hypothetical protein GTA08_BOTSDO08613 [Neofusicoccum parvum]
MSSSINPPTLHTDVYDAISPEALRGSLLNKVVVITGAAGGLGTGESIAFAKAGAKLALIDIPQAQQSLEKVVLQCKEFGAEAHGYLCDVTQDESSTWVYGKILADFEHVDVLVNNAGRTNDRPFHMQSFDAFWSVLEVNLRAPLFWTHMMLPHFRERGKGTIINIASRAATVNTPFGVNYCSSKAALVRSTGCLQLEADLDGLHGIEVYALHPGANRTNMVKPLDPDVAEMYPEVSKVYTTFANNFRCKPALCGQTCVFLAAGKGRALKGKYFDCEQDVGYVASMAEEMQAKELYELKVDFLGGLPNDGGTAKGGALFGGDS